MAESNLHRWRTNFSYALLYGTIYLLSLLPMFALYGLSNLIYLVLYKIIGYRKAVVADNISKSFPEKSKQEIQQIISDFYHHLCDTIVETLKSTSMSKSMLTKRVNLINPEIFPALAANKTGVVFIASHYCNTDWMLSRIDMQAGDLTAYGVYAPIRNPLMERLVRKLRTRWGNGVLVPMKSAIKTCLELLKDPCIVGFVADQSPSRRERLYFTDFLGRLTAIHDSPAFVSLKAEIPVYFMDMIKLRRGYYQIEIVHVPSQQYLPYSPANAQALTDDLAEILEKRIIEKPAYWLWSHRRWKHNPRDGDTYSVKLSPKKILSQNE